MKNILESIFGTSYRTAILGYAGGIFFAIEPILQNGTFNIKKDKKKGLALLIYDLKQPKLIPIKILTFIILSGN